jgi:hypothetical protein
LRRFALEDAENFKESLALVHGAQGHALEDHLALRVIALPQPQLHLGAGRIAAEQLRADSSALLLRAYCVAVNGHDEVAERNLMRPRGRRAWHEA